MSHITREQAVALAIDNGSTVTQAFSSKLKELTDLHQLWPHELEALCDAAIQHYIDSAALAQPAEPALASLLLMQEDHLLAARIAEGYRPASSPPLTMPLAGLLYAKLTQPVQPAEPVELSELELWKSDELMAINAEMGLPMNLLKPFVQAVLKLAAAKRGAV